MKLNQIPKRLGGLLSALPKPHKPGRENLFLLIVSFLAAVLLWTNLVPDDPKKWTLDGISVDLTDTQAESYNLKLLPESEAALSAQKVKVSIEGNKTAIGGLTKDDVEVYVDYEKVRKEPGEQTLSLGLRRKKDRENGGKEIKSDSGGVTKVELDPPTVIVSLDRYDSKTVPVSKTVLHPDLKPADDVTRIDESQVIVDPATVIVKGPSTKIDQIDHVSLTVGSSGKLTETKTFNDVSELTLMDSSGRQIDNSSGLFTVQQASFSVTFPVYYQRSLPVSVTIDDLPDKDDEGFRDFVYERIRLSMKNELYTLPGYGEENSDGTVGNNLFITLRTEDKQKKQGLEEVEYFPLFSTELGKLSIDEEQNVPVDVHDYEVVTDISEVYVSLADTDLKKQLFWIPNSKIDITSKKRPGYQYQLDQPNGQTAVWLIGREEDLEQIKEDDLKLTAEFYSYTESGRQNIDCSLKLPESAGFVWMSTRDKDKPTVDINITPAPKADANTAAAAAG